jgi:3-deoxy-7-phosphoheptulonate synthase
MAKAAVACGADGLLIEVHCDPAQALSDGKQSLYPAQFATLMRELVPFVKAAGKSLA